METNIVFENVTAYNVTKFDVKLTEEFKIELASNDDQPILWFANNDMILQIVVADDGQSADIKATGKGICKIQLQDLNNVIVKTLNVEVFDNITTSLNPKVEKPIIK